MSPAQIEVYRMNPQTDRIVFSDELTEGMWVLAEWPPIRSPHGSDEDSRIRAQRFRQVTRLRRSPASKTLTFVGEWVDGYQEVHQYAESYGWLVRKDPEPDAAADGEATP
jgi:hypothetical protein